MLGAWRTQLPSSGPPEHPTPRWTQASNPIPVSLTQGPAHARVAADLRADVEAIVRLVAGRMIVMLVAGRMIVMLVVFLRW